MGNGFHSLLVLGRKGEEPLYWVLVVSIETLHYTDTTHGVVSLVSRVSCLSWVHR